VAIVGVQKGTVFRTLLEGERGGNITKKRNQTDSRKKKKMSRKTNDERKVSIFD